MWLNGTVVNALQQQNAAFQSWKKEKRTHPDSVQLHSLYAKWKSFVKAAKGICKRARKDYLSEEFEKCENIMDFWKLIRRTMRHRKQSVSMPPILTDLVGKLLTDTGNKISTFIEFFATTFNCSDIYHRVPLLPDAPVLPEWKCSRRDVLIYFGRMSNRAAMGTDGINPVFLKAIKFELAEPIAFLINWCLEENYYPAIFMEARITPVPRMANPTTVGHYRPISVLNALSKF